MQYPLPGEIYKHYKGGTYEVISMTTHTETNEVLVVYKSINFGTVYARPIKSWNDPTPEYKKRFILIDEN